MNARLLPVAAAGLVLAACAAAPPADPLVSSRWYLTSIERPSQQPITLSGRSSDEHWLSFSPDGSLIASLDCNRGNGRWQRMGAAGMGGDRMGGLEIGEIASTRALCPTPSYGEEMAASLPLATAYELVDDGRELVIRTRTATYRLIAR